MAPTKVVSEVSSGLNGHRTKLLSLLKDQRVGVIVVEHRDRLARFGVEYLEAALAAQRRRLVVVEDAEVTDDLVPDMVEVLPASAPGSTVDVRPNGEPRRRWQRQRPGRQRRCSSSRRTDSSWDRTTMSPRSWLLMSALPAWAARDTTCYAGHHSRRTTGASRSATHPSRRAGRRLWADRLGVVGGRGCRAGERIQDVSRGGVLVFQHAESVFAQRVEPGEVA